MAEAGALSEQHRAAIPGTSKSYSDGWHRDHLPILLILQRKRPPLPRWERGPGEGVGESVLPLDVLAETVAELRLTELPERFGLDLADPLPADAKLLADL